ncbi:hypothetical protein Tco_0259321, partial [Tanacetum coccineum]
PRVYVKGQVLADFIIERPEEEGQDDSAKEEEPLPAQITDSGKNKRPKPPSKCRLKTGSKPSEFGIHYRPRVFVKGQVLADFIIERPEEEGQDDFAKEEEPLPAQ